MPGPKSFWLGSTWWLNLLGVQNNCFKLKKKTISKFLSTWIRLLWSDSLLRAQKLARRSLHCTAEAPSPPPWRPLRRRWRSAKREGRVPIKAWGCGGARFGRGGPTPFLTPRDWTKVTLPRSLFSSSKHWYTTLFTRGLLDYLFRKEGVKLMLVTMDSNADKRKKENELIRRLTKMYQKDHHTVSSLHTRRNAGKAASTYQRMLVRSNPRFSVLPAGWAVDLLTRL